MNNIINRIKGHFNERIQPIKDLAMDEGITALEWTVQRALKRRGYTKRIAYRSLNIKPHQAAKRLAFCEEYLAKPDDWFEHGIFTDEASFSTLLNRKARVLRTKDERYSADCIQFSYQSGRQTFMVWGAIGYGWKSELVILEPTGKRGITAVDYSEQVLHKHLGPSMEWARDFDDDAFIVEDNAPVHSRRISKAIRDKYNIHSIDWPAVPPDFNPIENVWRIIKQRL